MKKHDENVHLSKISILLHFRGEILVLLLSDDSIQILLILPQNLDKIRSICMEAPEHKSAISHP